MNAITSSNTLDDSMPRPISAAQRWMRALAVTDAIDRNPSRTFPTVIADLANRYGAATALISNEESFSFRELFERSNQYARWAQAQQIGRGVTVCLLMHNRAEYLAIWIGILRAGGVAALLNTNSVGSSLLHCIRIANPAHIIVTSELSEHLEEIQHQLPPATIWVYGPGGSESRDLAAEVGHYHRGSPGEPEWAAISTKTPALLVYTSGTTGMPKAAQITHHRLLVWTHWFAGMMSARPGDRMYNCLPMYHSVGGAVAIGATLINGGTVVVRPNFSVTRFWDEILQFDCTIFQYIGEMCRHLSNAPARATDRRHRLRMCCGNGLRADIWERFTSRFAIPQVLEFYAATETNVSLFNVEGRPGSIGRVPAFMEHRSAIALVRIDAFGEPLRDQRKFCIRCGSDEIGEALGRIRKDPSADSDGFATPGFAPYTDRIETERKILKDVFEVGDAWYRTGDLMRRDREGFFYFVDRIGDTYRWKGENVSTTEVASVLTAFPGICEANVYGIELPQADGRAGLAEIVCAHTLDLAKLYDHLSHELPRAAIPVLLRLCSQIAATPTFKHLKGRSRSASDLADALEHVYLLQGGRLGYVPLDAQLYGRLTRGQLRL